MKEKGAWVVNVDWVQPCLVSGLIGLVDISLCELLKFCSSLYDRNQFRTRLARTLQSNPPYRLYFSLWNCRRGLCDQRRLLASVALVSTSLLNATETVRLSLSLRSESQQKSGMRALVRCFSRTGEG